MAQLVTRHALWQQPKRRNCCATHGCPVVVRTHNNQSVSFFHTKTKRFRSISGQYLRASSAVNQLQYRLTILLMNTLSNRTTATPVTEQSPSCSNLLACVCHNENTACREVAMPFTVEKRSINPFRKRVGTGGRDILYCLIFVLYVRERQHAAFCFCTVGEIK